MYDQSSTGNLEPEADLISALKNLTFDEAILIMNGRCGSIAVLNYACSQCRLYDPGAEMELTGIFGDGVVRRRFGCGDFAVRHRH
jgi:hypothetical protein